MVAVESLIGGGDCDWDVVGSSGEIFRRDGGLETGGLSMIARCSGGVRDDDCGGVSAIVAARWWSGHVQSVNGVCVCSSLWVKEMEVRWWWWVPRWICDKCGWWWPVIRIYC
ncbi:hypothetical protin [Striga asiatica]|uniref:Hypothetical protin n=1 Tax=Striga asiatica TaxID=4170 RepID=A0A5A7QD12_STRAF|nr:hypothetical protin [Striga asiatica]